MAAQSRSEAPAGGPVDLDALGPQALRARRTLKWNRFSDDVIPMWIAELDFPTDPLVLAAIRRAVDAESLGYPLTARGSGLDLALAEWSQREHGWSIDPDGVHLVPNVVKGVGLALETLCDHDAPVVIPMPAYMPFFDVVRLRGLEHVPVPMLRATPDADAPWLLDLDAVESAFLAGARTIILCNPHNPLGHVHTRAEMLALADVVERHGARVISDEIHSPLVFDGVHVPYAGLTDATAAHTVTVTSASKAWNLPGLTCAQVVLTSAADVDRWAGIPLEKTIGVGTLGIAANLAAYREGGAWMAQVRERLAHNRLLVADAVASMPGVTHRTNEATYLAWLDLTGLDLDLEPADWLLEHARVGVSDGAAFGAPPHRFARLNFGTTAPLLDEALTRIAAAVATRH
ncbi:MAG: aminotransferase class I/II-fold pyridoxal phosphate-dependent enzyme [Lapillicoccus sp.]